MSGAVLEITAGCGTLLLVHDQLVWRDKDGGLLLRCSRDEGVEFITHSAQMLKQVKQLPGTPGARIKPVLAGLTFSEKIIVANFERAGRTSQMILSSTEVIKLTVRLRSNIGMEAWTRESRRANRRSNRLE